MSASHRYPCARLLVLVLGLVAGRVAAQGSVSAEPSFGTHYWESTKGASFGAGLGLAFGFAASAGGKEETMAVSSGLGMFAGMVLGSAYYANTVTPRHEDEGSFALDLVGSFGTTGLAMVMIAGADGAGDEAKMILFFGGMAAIPLGSVLMQRMVAGSPPRVAAWHPVGASPETMGVVVSWGIR